MAAATRAPDQNRRLWGLANALAREVATGHRQVPAGVAAAPGRTVAEQWLRHITREVSGQTSTRRLTPQQADQVIARLEAEGRRAAPGPAAAPPPAGRRGARIPADRHTEIITPGQQDYLCELLSALAQREGAHRRMAEEGERWQAWCRHYLKRPWPQTQRDADVAIEAAKSMLYRTLPPAEELDRILMGLNTHPALTTWERRFVDDGWNRSGAWGPLQWLKLLEVQAAVERRSPKTPRGA